jgi:hypothetical protein
METPLEQVYGVGNEMEGECKRVKWDRVRNSRRQNIYLSRYRE